MRTVNAAHANLISNPKRAVHTRVTLSDEAATPWEIDLTDHVGKNWVRSVEYTDSQEQQCVTVTVRLRREFDALSLMPGLETQANVKPGAAVDTFEDAIVEKRLVIVEANITPPAMPP